MRELEEQKPESFVAGPCLSITCKATLTRTRTPDPNPNPNP